MNTSIPFWTKQISGQSCSSRLITYFGFVLFSLTIAAATAQSNVTVAPPEPITTDALPHLTWKSNTEYASVLSTERSNTALLLAAPGLKESTFALYTGYDNLLSSMQDDLLANVPISGIAEKNFKQILLKASSDPVLKNMKTEEFLVKYDALVSMLVQL
jgi:hypothetical protein